ncbi:hypothetical protein NAEX_07797 [Nannocystis exedens]|nr:hypothetical protein NAEX_07797 [Nannocystis exedens]
MALTQSLPGEILPRAGQRHRDTRVAVREPFVATLGGAET